MPSFTFAIDSPIQGWSLSPNAEMRNADTRPAYSALLGMTASACGIARTEEIGKLKELQFDVRIDDPGTVYNDYATATIRTDRPNWMHLPKEPGRSALVAAELSKIRKKGYRIGAKYQIAVSHPDREYLEVIRYALTHPKWALFAGKRNCPITILPDAITDENAVQKLIRTAKTDQFELISNVPIEDADFTEIRSDQPVHFHPSRKGAYLKKKHRIRSGIRKRGSEMYLSLIPLDPSRKETVKIIRNPDLMHKLTGLAVNPERIKSRRPEILWRMQYVNTIPYLYLLTSLKPDFSCFDSVADPDRPIQCELYDPLLERIENGQIYRFVIQINSVRRRLRPRTSPDDRRTCSDQGVFGQNKIYEYLKERMMEKFGFEIAPDQLYVMSNKKISFRKAGTDHNVPLYPALLEGYLRVTNAERFKYALTCGIGRGKAYGCGLLTIFPA